MINLKQVNLGFNIILILVLIFGCAHKESSSATTNELLIYQTDNWIQGRRLYLDNCSFCHIPVEKDVEFQKYLKSKQNLSESMKIKDIKKIITNELHKDIGADTLSSEQIKSLLIFIETPRKSGTAN